MSQNSPPNNSFHDTDHHRLDDTTDFTRESSSSVNKKVYEYKSKRPFSNSKEGSNTGCASLRTESDVENKRFYSTEDLRLGSNSEKKNDCNTAKYKYKDTTVKARVGFTAKRYASPSDVRLDDTSEKQTTELLYNGKTKTFYNRKYSGNKGMDVEDGFELGNTTHTTNNSDENNRNDVKTVRDNKPKFGNKTVQTVKPTLPKKPTLPTSTKPSLPTSTKPSLPTSTKDALPTSTKPALPTSTKPSLPRSTKHALSSPAKQTFTESKIPMNLNTAHEQVSGFKKHVSSDGGHVFKTPFSANSSPNPANVICKEEEGKPNTFGNTKSSHKRGKGETQHYLSKNYLKAAYNDRAVLDVNDDKTKNELVSDRKTEQPYKREINSENRRKTHSRAKTCNLYVVMTEHLPESSDIKEYLKHRMGNPLSIDFEIVHIKHQNNLSDGCNMHVVVIRLPSSNKASAAHHLLNKSNRNTESKMYCYFTEDEAYGAKVKHEKDNKQLIITALNELVDTSSKFMDKHDTKIREMQDLQEKCERRMTGKRGLSLNEFNMLTNEKRAHEDKLTELEGQRKEFTHYLQSMKAKMKELRQNKKVENEIREIRKDFGVECRKLSSALPMYARRENIVSTIKENRVSVVLGETGSGKSTQMVQYLYQAGFADKGLIACTQPRKIAAINLATHVSSELASSVGQIVGYQVGLQSRKTASTKVLFVTDHVLLNECLRDSDLSAYSCIIIDEAHERSIYTDLLLGMLKNCIAIRPELRVVITSATIDSDVFVTYFGGPHTCPVLSISGRIYPVDVIWDADNGSCDIGSPFPEDYENKALTKAIEIHTSHSVSDGDILVFLTSALESEKCCEKFRKKVQGNDYHCLQLHGKLKNDEQQLVFAPSPRGKRKIVFATNSAETSITIPGIKFVVDTGVAKEMRYDPKKNMNSLDVVPVSQSSANQRKGRAGRTDTGICYRLYTQRDFKSMNKAGTPEILRIHLGQGLLKLMELGVNPMAFDFVQAPAAGAMEAALDTLVDLGAVDDTEITELGKWIAKLPVEPRLGALIKRGIDEGIPTEAIMIAACCNQVGIFFRVGSQEQKKKADLKKVRFCHKGGDLLTTLCAFREWDKVSERGKGKWCVENCINGKLMKGIRDTMNETLSILRKEKDLKLNPEFKTPEEADVIVQKLVFSCMKSNVCFYLGHENAGYVTADRLQHVKVHPSSSLLPLGQQPTWVVYSQLLKTCENDDFITTVTPVPEEYIDNAIEAKVINIDKEDLQRRQVKLARKIPVGKHVFWKFVGPMHKNRREVEDNIRALCAGTVVVVEADKFRGEVTLYCVAEYKHDAIAMLEDSISPLHGLLLYESREEAIGNELCGVRAVIREGGDVATILMPQQFRSMNIKQKDFRRYDLTEEDAHQMLSFYGQIEQVWRSCGKRQQNQMFWGRVTFVNELEALSAVQEINEDEDCDFTVVPITYRSQGVRPPEFTMKLKWCRRPSKGICYVYLSCPEDMSTLLLASPIEIDNGLAHVNTAHGNSDLFIRGLDVDVTEEHIKEGLLRALHLSTRGKNDRFKVIIPRQTVLLRQGEMNHVCENLTQIMSRFVERASFRIELREYQQQTVYVIAFVKFSDPTYCTDAVKGLVQNDAEIDGNVIEVNTEFKTSVFLNRKVYEVTKTDIDAFLERRRLKRSNTSVQMRTLKSGNLSIDVNAESPKRLANVKVAIDAIVGGLVLEIGVQKNVHVLFTRDGRQKMQAIERMTGVLVVVDDRTMKVTVQGSVRNRMLAVALIDTFVEEVAAALEREIPLKGQNNPPGLMKAILVKYGTGLETLRIEAELISIRLNLRMHELTITGNENAIKKVVDAVEGVKEEVAATETKLLEEEEFPGCPICLCPIEITEICRMEYCGHAYCNVCLVNMIQIAVQDKQFPIKCAADGCGKAIVIRDINAQIKQGNINIKELTRATVGCFVAKNNKAFRFCITPDCDMVYRVTSDGTAVTCSLCQTKICTSCHLLFHDGITCAMYRSAKNSDKSIQKWLQEDPRKRKLCPQCEIGIEKIEGCDHMKCVMCGAHICWKCLKYFADENKCYGHLKKEHGSFV